jgi:flagellar basal-body rod protein FlgB
MLNQLSSTFDFQSEALKLRSERQQVLASNIANADTPNYQARDFDFKAALSSATHQLQNVASAVPAAMAKSAAGHMAGATLSTLSLSGTPELQYRTPAQGALDANTVDMDVERANFADNSIRYEAALRFLNGHIKTMNLAVNGQ